MRATNLIAVVLAVAGGGEAQGAEASNAAETQAAPALKAYRSPQGVSYTVERVPGFKVDQLPMNDDLKTADSDLGKYAETLCALNVPARTAPRRCDIYVQADLGGTLIGYAAITQDAKGVSFQTTTTINEKKQLDGGACSIGGRLAGLGLDWKHPLLDAAKDFSGQFAYMAWSAGSDGWLAEPIDGRQGIRPQNAVDGLWRVEKKGDTLHIFQERWNYCYRDSSVVVDDIFHRAVTLIRK